MMSKNSLKNRLARHGLLGLALIACSACVLAPAGPDPGPGPAYGYYGYGPDYPWAYGTSINIYDHGGYRGGYRGYRGGGYHGGGGFHGNGRGGGWGHH